MASSSLEKLQAIVGERVEAVVITKSKSGMRRGYIVLPDKTHVELFVRDGGVASRFPGDVDELIRITERDGGTVVAVRTLGDEDGT